MKTLNDVKRMIRELDPYLDEGDRFFEAAVIMLSALVVGADEQAIAQFSGIPLERIEPRAQKLRRSGRWRGQRTIARWDDAALGDISFWIDTLIAEGLLEVNHD